MAAGRGKPLPALGFLTVVDDVEHGCFGGYLLLNQVARPLEFHCTTPVKPNRAQEILYGPTLQPYLYGEQIAATLIGKAAVKPLAIFTDLSAVLAARPLVKPPIGLVMASREREEETNGPFLRLAGEKTPPAMNFAGPKTSEVFRAGVNRLAVHAEHAQDRESIIANLTEMDELDLGEPFTRIREAITEAQRASSRQAA